MDTLFQLLRVALGEECHPLPQEIDWQNLTAMSYEQGVAPLCVDGLQMFYEKFPELEFSLDTPELEMLKYEWFGMALNCEETYERHEKVIADLAEFYHSHGVDMMLLKGYGLSLNYPIPCHRGPGDIDIYLWDDWERADRQVEASLGIKVDNSHHHHSVFHYEGVMVENHYDFVNAHSHASSHRIEALFKGLAADKSQAVPCDLPGGARIYLPPADLNALFVMRHNAAHFAADGITMRHLLDWALFVRSHHEEVSWDLFWSKVSDMGMQKFAMCINAIAVEQLGFAPEIFHTPALLAGWSSSREGSALVSRVLSDILSHGSNSSSGASSSSKPGALKYIHIRFLNWWHNRWKHRLVYTDSLFSTFFVQLWSHLLKPASLRGK